jgi:geranyl-CoA carboxylase beta subunit
MPVIESKIMINSESFKKNQEDHQKLIDEIRTLEQKIADNSARSKAKFDKRGQLLPRERLKRLLDPGSFWLPLSTLAGYKIGDDDGDKNIGWGNSISGIGYVAGVRCMIGVSDAGIKGGSASAMGTEKALRGAQIIFENKLPFIQLIESAGANLLRQTDMFIKGGRSFANLSKMSASLGEIATDEEIGGADLHFAVSGLAEYMANDDAHAIEIARDVMKNIGWNNDFISTQKSEYDEPVYSPDELTGVVPVDYKTPYDCREVIARIVDGSDFLEFKEGWGKTLITGHATIQGYKVGILGNNGPIFSESANKATQFIQICSQSNTPLIFLQNIT